MVVHACNTSTLGSQVGRITWAQEFETSLSSIGRPCLYKKYKIRWACCDAPVVPETLEAEVGDPLSLGGGGCSEPWLCHCTPAWATEWGPLSKKIKQTFKVTRKWVDLIRDCGSFPSFCFGFCFCLFVFWVGVSHCCPGWSTVVQSWLPVTSTFWVEVIRLSQPPK